MINQWIWLLLTILSLVGCDQLLNNDDKPAEPQIKLVPEATVVSIGASQRIKAVVSGIDDTTTVSAEWQASAGTLENISDLTVLWTAPDDTTQAEISVKVTTVDGGSATRSVTVSVGNAPPQIDAFQASDNIVLAGNQINLTVSATDPENFALSYRFWSIPDSGVMAHLSPEKPTATWTAPEGSSFRGRKFQFVAEVSDNLNFVSRDTIEVLAYADYESIWVVDSGNKTVSKYTANGLKILTSPVVFENPVAVCNDVTEFYGCYVADYDAGKVVKLDARGNTIAEYTDIPTVIDIEIHRDTRRLWALEVGRDVVTVIDGYTHSVLKTIKGFKQPRWVTINQATGDVWIAEPSNNRLICLNSRLPVGSLPDSITAANTAIYPDTASAAYLNSPVSPFVRHDVAQPVYVVDRDDRQIEQFEWNGSRYVRNAFPVALGNVNPLFVWSATVGNVFSMIASIASDGKLQGYVEGNSGSLTVLTGDYTFQAPHTLAVDPPAGIVWIGDNGTNQMVKIRLNPDFTYQKQFALSGFVFLEDVVINK
jgi:hypothetical protein